MKNLLRDLISDAVDRDALIQAMADVIAGHLDYEDLADTIYQAKESEIEDMLVDIAASMLGIFDDCPF